MFDLLATEYGYTINEILDLTFAQIDGMIIEINKRHRNKAEYEATLHQMTLKGSHQEDAKVNLSEDQESTLDEIMRKRVLSANKGKEVKEYGTKHRNNNQG